MKKTALILFTLLTTLSCYSQTYWSAEGGKGFVIPHRPEMRHLVRGHSHTLGLTYLKKTDGSKSWHSLYGNPNTGFHFQMAEMGNPKELGQAYSLLYLTDLPLSIKKRKTFLSLGFGASYFTKKFELEENFKNVAIGSHVNMAVMFALYREFLIQQKVLIHTGLKFNHYSNGAFQSPNLGINIPSAFIRVGINTSKQFETPKSIEPLAPFQKSWNWAITWSTGVKENVISDEKKYFTQDYVLTFQNQASAKVSYQFNADVFYNSAIIKARENLDLPTHGISDNWQAGVSAGASLHLGQLAYYLQMGVYAYSQLPNKNTFYHRLGAKWYFTEKWDAQIILKSHFAKADYFSIGLTYHLN